MTGGNMKHFFRLILGVIIVLGFQNNALAASSLKIGVVDIQKLQKQSKAFSKGESEIKEEI